jgi:hypothetical protein
MSAVAVRRIDDSRPPHQPVHRLLQLMVVGDGGVFPRDDYQVPAGLHFGQTGCLSEAALHPVSRDRYPDPLANHESEPTDLKSVGPRYQHEPAIGPAFAFSARRGEIPGFTETLLSAHQALPVEAYFTALNGQLLPSFEYSPFQHLSSAARTHSGAKPVDPHTASLARLVRSFCHFQDLVICRL